MAKWGEGDPRWIVEERPDARNVNNWHWTEKDVSEWSVNKLKILLTNLRINTESIQCCITQMEKHEGEAFVHNRKGKLISFFEWRLVLNWESRITFDESAQSTGKIYILNFSEEYEVSDLVLEVSISKSTIYDGIIRDLLTSTGKEIIQQQLSIYISDLKNEHFSSLILPKKGDVKSSRENEFKEPKQRVTGHVISSGNHVNKSETVSTVDITMNVTFFCTKENLYKCLTDIELVNAFTQGAVDKMEAETHGSFELFGGNVIGTFVELIPNTRIVQTWRFQGWPKGHFSEVSIDFLGKDGSTEAKLLQKYVPEDFLDSTKENWYKYYWDPIKRTFGYGYFLVSQDFSLL